MANYSITINSKFRPFSYAEMLAPVQAMTQAHQAVEDQYSDLMTKASVWENMANEQNDPRAYAMYKSYADKLMLAADDLNRNGLTAQSRPSLMALKAGYASHIAPIEVAYKLRNADITAQKEALLKDPTHLFNRKASNISLDEYINNPNLDVLSENYSGALLTQQVGNAVANLKQTLLKKGNLTKLGLPYQYERMLQYGATADQVFDAMAKDPKALPILMKAVDDVMASSGIRSWSSMGDDWANNELYKRAEAYAMQGLYNAIGTSKIDNFTDSYSMHDALNARQHARQVAYAEQQNRQSTRLNPLALRSSQELSTSQKEIDRWLKAGYFKPNPDGSYALTPAGYKELRRISTVREYSKAPQKGWLEAITNAAADPQISASVKPMTSKKVHTEFYDFMVKLNGGKSFMDEKGKVLPGWGPNRIGNLFSSYITKNQEGSYDTYHSTEYDRQLPNEYGEEVMTQLWSASRTDKGKRVLDQVDFNGKNGWKNEKTLNSEDLNGYRVSNIRYSKWGNTAILSKDGEEPIRVRIPKGIHLAAEHNVNTSIKNADDYGLVLSVGKRPATVRDANGNLDFKRDHNGDIVFTNSPLTEADKIVFSQYQLDALDEMGQYGSQLVVPSKTSDEQIKQFNF